MTRIKKVFVEMGKLRAPTNHHIVRMGIGGPTHTELVNRQPEFGLISTLNPVIFNEEAVSMSYEPWEFLRGPNRELSKAHIVVGCFTDSVVSSPSTSQLLKEPQQQRSSESTSADSREE